jgi:hypothetical protein
MFPLSVDGKRKDESMAGEDASRSKLEHLAYVAAIFAGASALLYVLGVITLWVQLINYRNTQDFYTSAYAVATVPSTVTAGVGVKTIVDTLWAAITATYIYAIFFIIFVAGVLALDYRKSRREREAQLPITRAYLMMSYSMKMSLKKVKKNLNRLSLHVVEVYGSDCWAAFGRGSCFGLRSSSYVMSLLI